MSTKLTLSADQFIVAQIKDYARKRGVSISELVEEYFKQLIKKDKKGSLPDSFFEISGIWADRKETNHELREKAWKRK